MKYYYHSTPAKNLPSILREGLKPGCLGCVCMTEKPEECLRFPVIETDAEEIYTLRIKTYKADESKIEETFDHCEAFWQCRCYGFFGEIPPDRIEPVYVWRREMLNNGEEEK